MKFTLCKLKPKGPLHLGEKEGWLEGTATIIHSDTLFSAFCHAYQLLYEDLPEILKEFEENSPPFLISSAFPYWRDVFFFPFPKNQLPKDNELAKIKFVDKSGFEKLLQGERLEKIIKEIKTIPATEEPFFPWELIDIPRVGLGRLDNRPGERFFYFGQVIYSEDAGLFFLIKFQKEEIRPKFEATMYLLADEGIGGDRSSGKGLFEKPIFEEIEIETPTDADGVISLSLYYPKEEKELMGIKNAFYDLIERKGYLFSPYCSSLRRRSIRMFVEGSVFPNSPEKIIGTLVSVEPEIFKLHKVYRYGYLFGLPCKREG
jgi:CRISPR-associated protein Csm4